MTPTAAALHLAFRCAVESRNQKHMKAVLAAMEQVDPTEARKIADAVLLAKITVAEGWRGAS